MRAKLLIVGAFDALSLAAVAAIVSFAWVTPAYAYVDPSVMTYAIQALAGVAVALGAVAGVALRRTRKQLFKLLHIDENRNKDVEGDIHRVEGGIAQHAAHVAGTRVPAASGAGAAKAPERPKVRWRARLVYALISVVFLVYTVFVVAPLEIVSGASGSLIFGVGEVWPVLAVAAAALAVGGALIVSALRGKAFDAVLLLCFSLGLGAYVQVMFLNAALPPADGKAIMWPDYTAITLISAVVWGIVIAAPLAVSHWKAGLVRGVATALAACLIVVQSVGVASLFVSLPSDDGAPAEDGYEHTRMTQDGLFEVSEKDNVIVFVLDTIDTRRFGTILSEDPSVLDGFEGFTYYNDAAGSAVPTRYAVPYLLTGEKPQPGELFSTYLNQRYDRSPYLSSIKDAGYSVGVYTDTDGFEYLTAEQSEDIAALTENIKAKTKAQIDPVGTVEVLWQCALYRDAPWLAKPFFWFYTDDVNKGMAAKDAGGDEALYTLNDPAYFAQLKEQGLAATDDGEHGAFRFIHLNGGHGPYSMDAEGNDVGQGNADNDGQIKGTMRIVAEYLRQLKELGLYDDATIVVTADHGEWYTTLEWDDPSSAFMLVKPAETPAEAAAPVRFSDAPVSHESVLSTVLEAVDARENPYGEPAQDVSLAPRERFFYATTSDGKHDQQIVEYTIEGKSADFGSWKETGNRWDAQE